MRNKIISVALLILAATHPVVAEIDDLGPYRVKREFGQFTPMRDGILLATDLYCC